MLTAESYLWEHWKFNADQRLKAFNLYVVFSIFADGMAFTGLDKGAHPLVLIFMGGFVGFLAIVFAIVDVRSRRLLRLVKQGLKDFERDLPLACRPLSRDEMNHRSMLRYTVAFNMLFVLQLLFGLLVVGFGAVMGYRGVSTW